MTMKELLPQIIDLMIPVAIALLAWLSASATRWINSKVKNEYLRGALERLNDAVYTAVKASEQTLVKELREAAKDGKITKDEAEEIKKRAVDSAKAYIGDKGMAELKRVIDPAAIEKLIEDKIEAYLLDRKMDLAAMVIGNDGLDGDGLDEEEATDEA